MFSFNNNSFKFLNLRNLYRFLAFLVFFTSKLCLGMNEAPCSLLVNEKKYNDMLKENFDDDVSINLNFPEVRKLEFKYKNSSNLENSKRFQKLLLTYYNDFFKTLPNNRRSNIKDAKNELIDTIENPNVQIYEYIVNSNGKSTAVSYATLEFHKDENIYEINEFWTKEEHRGKRYGEKLLNFLLTKCIIENKKIVLVSSDQGEYLYKKLMFKNTKREVPDFINTPSQSMIMKNKLDCKRAGRKYSV